MFLRVVFVISKQNQQMQRKIIFHITVRKTQRSEQNFDAQPAYQKGGQHKLGKENHCVS